MKLIIEVPEAEDDPNVVIAVQRAVYSLGYGQAPVWPIDGLNEDKAYELFDALRDQFGWGVVIMMRADAAANWHHEDPDMAPALTDEQWEAVQDTLAWQAGWSTDFIMETANGIVADAVGEAKTKLGIEDE